MASVVVKKLNKTYPNGFCAVKDINLEIEDKEFMVLVGPSGCGKTTTLRMIAGLEDISKGDLYIGEERVNEVAPKDRDIAMVFQNYALYPHMTVYENMSFGLKLKHTPKVEIAERVGKAAKILDIESLLTRKPKQLSGGQRQRVALGRAIVRKPEVFLMDEPLSNLDAKLRVQMRAELIKLHKDLASTFVYVTHDQTEAMTMGTRICVMNAGEIQQVADPKTIYNAPENIFVAGFIGAPQMNFFEGELVKVENGICADFGGYLVPLSEKLSKVVSSKNYYNKKVILGIRPEDIRCSDNQTGLKVTIGVTELLGADLNVYFEQGGKQFIFKTDADKNYKVGDEIIVQIDAGKIHLFEVESQKSFLYLDK